MGQEEGAEGPEREGEVSEEPVTHDCSETFSPHTLKETLEVSMVLKYNTIQYNIYNIISTNSLLSESPNVAKLCKCRVAQQN